MSVNIHAIFKGRVQGVGFRYTTQQYALQLGLKGTVSNRPNGSVEIYVQGEQNAIDTLFDKLQNEAGFTISSLAKEEIPLKNNYIGFRVI